MNEAQISAIDVRVEGESEMRFPPSGDVVGSVDASADVLFRGRSLGRLAFSIEVRVTADKGGWDWDGGQVALDPENLGKAAREAGLDAVPDCDEVRAALHDAVPGSVLEGLAEEASDGIGESPEAEPQDAMLAAMGDPCEIRDVERDGPRAAFRFRIPVPGTGGSVTGRAEVSSRSIVPGVAATSVDGIQIEDASVLPDAGCDSGEEREFQAEAAMIRYLDAEKYDLPFFAEIRNAAG
ncbi:hypothetical protein CKO28_18760 [Rhodovibrio sodomensis]|uniref:Uncharacterized protein n=1 Tax=Rhodovibrio sodomensis TaxID=1088 RepID=A0ABS1DHY2_9PROT|nr:hypothetical protein [Rhodovibrio sodomensis]MBK1670080.1 hypothetical protein [Rhodovibrio sodomensis]